VNQEKYLGRVRCACLSGITLERKIIAIEGTSKTHGAFIGDLSLPSDVVDLRPVATMAAAKPKLVVLFTAGLLTVFAAGDAAAALSTTLLVGSQCGREVEIGESMPFLGDLLRSVEPLNGRSMPTLGTAGVELSPLLPCSGPAEERPDPEFERISVPLPGAGAIPPTFSGNGAGGGGAFLASESAAYVPDALRRALTTESRATLPRGPSFRWFRPPRMN